MADILLYIISKEPHFVNAVFQNFKDFSEAVQVSFPLWLARRIGPKETPAAQRLCHATSTTTISLFVPIRIGSSKYPVPEEMTKQVF